MRDSTELPDLQMIPTTLLVTHENADPRRVMRLSQRIDQEGCLKNPPIVAEIPETEKFVVLDGANRTEAFKHLKLPHIVVQLVDYYKSGVEVDTWYHVVSGLKLNDFEDALNQVRGMHLQVSSLNEARRSLKLDESIGYIICENGVRKIISEMEYESHKIQVLVDLVGTYKGKADIFRASNDIWEIQKPYYPEITALVIFPRYRPKDILSAAKNGYKVPSGVTRHIIPNRALNINIPLEVLKADWSLERKREWLNDWLMERMAANAIRYYAEPTFTFNE